MLVNGKGYRTVWMEGLSVFMIDQNKLPFAFEIIECKDHMQTAEAIKNMTVRGAGAIGATAGFAMAQAMLKKTDLDGAKKLIESTRPTAQNLFYATDRVYRLGIAEAQKIADEDVEACRAIGRHGETLTKDNMRIETHCNAGWLAFVDWGTATAPIYTAHRSGKKIFVYVDETRPRSQGARLTAWELSNEGVNHAIIPDNAGAYYMEKGEIDLMIVGADRIAANGDVANKIGTLEKAIAARHFNIPFYVAAPLSTFDIKCKSGENIPIEERSKDELLYQSGPNENGKIEKILVCNPGSKAMNPAFDVTPAELITGIITEKGIIRPNEIAKLFQ